MLFYHVAPASARAQIRAYGLEGASPHRRWPNLRQEMLFGVYVWSNLAAARAWQQRDESDDLARVSDGPTDVWVIEGIDPDDLYADPYYPDTGWVIADDGVDPELLSLYEGAKETSARAR